MNNLTEYLTEARATSKKWGYNDAIFDVYMEIGKEIKKAINDRDFGYSARLMALRDTLLTLKKEL